MPYDEAVAAMERSRRFHRARRGAGLRVAAWSIRQSTPPAPAPRRASCSTPDRFPVFRSGRGGRFTYHGPGQRVAYVMLDLAPRGRDVKAFVTLLEDWLIATLARLGVEGERRPGQIGIFVRGAKIASIGVRVRRWVTLHGVSLNVDPELEHFSGIVPCGLVDTTVTSLAALGAETDMDKVDDALRAAFEEVFGGDAAQRQRSVAITLKPDGGAPPSSTIVTAVTFASRGPSAQRLSISSTAAGGPENTASTLPSLAFRTQPSSPSACAVSLVQAR